MKILVTGGAGFIGSHIVDELIRRKHEVTIYDNLEPQVHPGGEKPYYLNRKARFVHGDIRDYESLKKVINDSQVIFHEASAVGVAQSQYEIKRYVDVNIGGTANLIDILINYKHKITKLIIAASMSSYGEGVYRCSDCGKVRPKLRSMEQMERGDWNVKCPECKKDVEPIPTDEEAERNCNSIYGITKRDQEDMAINIGITYGLPVVSLRCFNVYGPRQSLSNPYNGIAAIFMSRIKNNHSPVIYEDGLQSRDFISVHDVVKANILAMENASANGQIFNVGTGRPIAIKDIAEILARLYGKDISPEITYKFRKGDVRHCYSNTNKIRQLLGFQPEVPFEKGIQELIAWSKEVPAVDRFEKARNELEEKGLV